MAGAVSTLPQQAKDERKYYMGKQVIAKLNNSKLSLPLLTLVLLATARIIRYDIDHTVFSIQSLLSLCQSPILLMICISIPITAFSVVKRLTGCTTDEVLEMMVVLGEKISEMLAP